MQENLVSSKESKENQESEEIYSNTYIYGNNCECVDFKTTLKYYISEQFSDLNEFSKLSGISISSLYSYENGDRKISSDRLCIICLALKLHPSRQRYLFSLTDVKMPDAGYQNSARKKLSGIIWTAVIILKHTPLKTAIRNLFPKEKNPCLLPLKRGEYDEKENPRNLRIQLGIR